MSRTIRSGNHARPAAIEQTRQEASSPQAKERVVLEATSYNELRKMAAEVELEFEGVPKKGELVEALLGVPISAFA